MLSPLSLRSALQCLATTNKIRFCLFKFIHFCTESLAVSNVVTTCSQTCYNLVLTSLLQLDDHNNLSTSCSNKLGSNKQGYKSATQQVVTTLLKTSLLQLVEITSLLQLVDKFATSLFCQQLVDKL